GTPLNAGVMVNPNSDRAFRIAPEVTARLKSAAELSASFTAIDKKQKQNSAESPANTPRPAGDIERIMFDLEDCIISGDLKKAESILGRIHDTKENVKFVFCAKAMIAEAKGEIDDAIALINEAIRKNDDPRTAGRFWSMLARFYEKSNKLDLAEDAYIVACSSDPSRVNYALDLAKLLADQFRVSDALELLRKTEALHPSDALPIMQLGTILVDIGQEEAALAAYDRAATLEHNSAGVQFNRAICLQALGRLEEACLAFEHALRLDPTLDGYSQYVQIRKFPRDNPEANAPFLELLEQRARQSMPLSTRIDSTFALAKAYDSLGNLDKSFEYLQSANKLKRSVLTYTSSDTERDVDMIKRLFNKEFIERFKDKVALEHAPVFVLGMPRSGTTLTEQILAAHSKINPGNELTYFASMGAEFNKVWGKRTAAGKDTQADLLRDLRRLGETYIERTARLQLPGKRFTDKMPGNFMHIGLIYLLFPNASVIHCHRHPADTCLSCYERLFSKGLVFSYDLHDLGVYYGLYRSTMQHWRDVLPKNFVLDVKYEQMVGDPENQIRRLLDFCKLDFEEGCLDFHNVKRSVTTASSLQVRKPMYKSSLNRWKKYGDRLKPLLDALGPELVDEAATD
ncbi:MAG TPA: sulfotransferase, partial [Gammaproteobacteria bacterium]|nr:sulfotransferase [Gammaproteobacteria bacterium]